MTESIQSIKERLKSIQRIDDPTLESLRNDPRKGVQQALASFERRLKKEALIKEKYEEMFCFEKQGYAQGHQWIAGIDEVGGKSAALEGELAEFQHAAVYHELDKALFICHLFFLQCPRA